MAVLSLNPTSITRHGPHALNAEQAFEFRGMSEACGPMVWPSPQIIGIWTHD
jgi:hypothetical protein